MINLHFPATAAHSQAIPRVSRIGPRAFWTLFAVEGLLVAAVLLALLHLLTPAWAPLARSDDYARVREAIWSRLNSVVEDPLIEAAPGVTVRESNLRGFALNGQTYYYYIEGRRGFDPLSRGAVDRDQIEVLLRDDNGPKTLVIYRLLR